jgi:hypothetical protein
MLRRVLEQMQFKREGTGGGCEVMSLYVDGHVIVVSIDAHTDFNLVGPDRPITVGIYQTLTEYVWSDENFITATDVHTQSEGITVVIDALDYVKQHHTTHTQKIENKLGELWDLLSRRHGWPNLCAYEAPMEEVDEPYRAEVLAWRTLWDSIAEGRDNG